jgi:hypothetical protein
MLDDPAAAAALRNPEIWHLQGLLGMMGDALPPGNDKESSPSISLYKADKAPGPAYAKFVQVTPDCRSLLRDAKVPVNSAKVKPVNLSMVNSVGGVNNTTIETFGAFATFEDKATDDSVIVEAKIAGNVP